MSLALVFDRIIVGAPSSVGELSDECTEERVYANEGVVIGETLRESNGSVDLKNLGPICDGNIWLGTGTSFPFPKAAENVGMGCWFEGNSTFSGSDP